MADGQGPQLQRALGQDGHIAVAHILAPCTRQCQVSTVLYQHSSEKSEEWWRLVFWELCSQSLELTGPQVIVR